MNKCFDLDQVAKLLQIERRDVSKLIRESQLLAVDVALHQGPCAPNLRVLRKHLEEFLDTREVDENGHLQMMVRKKRVWNGPSYV